MLVRFHEETRSCLILHFGIHFFNYSAFCRSYELDWCFSGLVCTILHSSNLPGFTITPGVDSSILPS
jgi:hypothetical protein